jgi:hypothetical protein
MPNAIAVPRRRGRTARHDSRQIKTKAGRVFAVRGTAPSRRFDTRQRCRHVDIVRPDRPKRRKGRSQIPFSGVRRFDAQAGLVPARDVLRLAQYDRVARVSIPLVRGARSAPNSTADVVATNPRGFSVPRMGNRGLRITRWHARCPVSPSASMSASLTSPRAAEPAGGPPDSSVASLGTHGRSAPTPAKKRTV